KDENGPNPERLTAEGDCGDPHERLDLVTVGDIGKMRKILTNDINAKDCTELNIGNTDNSIAGDSTMYPNDILGLAGVRLSFSFWDM
ncbi:hypothetical protein ACJX0J_035829, partial [Zea mays]